MKNMLKKMMIILTTLSLAVSLSACGLVNCKADGCDEEVHKDGFCEIHYAMNWLEENLW